jgi:phosphoenolpyruvate synthase/pyruvate phosphate dikinase
MRFVKFLTRKYTLLELSLIDESLLKKNTSIPGIYHEDMIDVSRKGLGEIYITKEDKKRSKKWIVEKTKNPLFLKKVLSRGLEAAKHLMDLPLDLPGRISGMNDEEIAAALLDLKKRIFGYGGYLDFTTYIDQMELRMDEESILKLAKFHDDRKNAFMNYFDFIKKVCDRIAEKKNLNPRFLDYLVFSEIIDFLEGRLTKEKVNELQNKRKEKYILIWEKGKRTIITDNFEENLEKIEKRIEKEEFAEIKGRAINKGNVKGIVKIVKQTDALKEIPSGRIIVTQMTNPEMTPILKKCKAIVTDEGGLLCHAAYIAREFGIIAVIGTKIATKFLKDNDLVEVDADKGIVRILKDQIGKKSKSIH